MPDLGDGTKRARYLQIAAAVSDQWERELLAASPPYDPTAHPEWRDYNLWHHIVDASGEQLDDRDRRILEAATAEGLEDFHPKRYGP